MSATSIVPPEVEAYLAAVSRALADLPTEERDDLLAEVQSSLVESAAEGGSPIARLGPPEDFAAELRAAAGLHEAAPPPPSPGSRLARLARDARAWAAREPRPAVLQRASELAPIWWALRGYLLVGVVGLVAGVSWSTAMPLVPRLGSARLGLAAIVAAVLVSVWIGTRLRARRALLTIGAVANLALLAAAVPVAKKVSDTARTPVPVTVTFEPAPAVQGLALNGVPVHNIYAYTRGGRLLYDVLLYDGAGTPIDVGQTFDDPLRRVLRTPEGKPVFNAFPIRYYEPGTVRVAHPGAAPRVEIPRIVTPPLRRNG